jgi:hypothetical protein
VGSPIDRLVDAYDSATVCSIGLEVEKHQDDGNEDEVLPSLSCRAEERCKSD